MTSQRTVSVIGCGVIGRGWVSVFLRAGWRVQAFDPMPEQLTYLRRWVQTEAQTAGDSYGKLVSCSSLAQALEGTSYAQESTQEDLNAKREIFAQMDRLAPAAAILGSSTSALDIEAIAGDLPGAARCVTAHPFNPPHVLPVVEVLATRAGGAEALERAANLLAEAGQSPVRMQRYAPGYIGNRLQAALMREALDLVVKGVTDLPSIESIMVDALAPRWALLGVFGTNHTNAVGGLKDYYSRFWKSYSGLIRELATEPPVLDDAAIDALAQAVERRFEGRSVADLASIRDALVIEMRELRRKRLP